MVLGGNNHIPPFPPLTTYYLCKKMIRMCREITCRKVAMYVTNLMKLKIRSYLCAYVMLSLSSYRHILCNCLYYNVILILYLVPSPEAVNVAVMSTQTVGQPLTLECNITTVRGITSRVDIVWSSDGSELMRIEGVNVSFTSESSETYSVLYDVMQLNTSDDGRVFQCEVIVNTNPPLVADNNITLDVTG